MIDTTTIPQPVPDQELKPNIKIPPSTDPTDAVCPYCETRIKTNISQIALGQVLPGPKPTMSILQCTAYPGQPKGCGRIFGIRIAASVSISPMKFEGVE